MDQNYGLFKDLSWSFNCEWKIIGEMVPIAWYLVRRANPSGAEAKISQKNKANIIAADALAPGITQSTAAMDRLSRMSKSLSSVRRDFNYLHHLIPEK